MDFIDALSELLPSLAQIRQALGAVLPRLAGALVVLLAGWLLAVVLRAAIRRLVRRLGTGLPPGKASEAVQHALRGGSPSVAGRAVFWTVMLATTMIAAEVAGLPVLTMWLGGLTSYVPRALLALAIVFGGVIAGRMLGNVVAGAARTAGSRHAERVGGLTATTTIVLASLVAVQQLGIDVSLLTTALLIVLFAVTAGAALAFALGARSVIANVLAMHYVQQTFRVGERIRVSDTEGRIIQTTPTGVVLESAEGEVTIPGSTFAENAAVRLRAEGAE